MVVRVAKTFVVISTFVFVLTVYTSLAAARSTPPTTFAGFIEPFNESGLFEMYDEDGYLLTNGNARKIFRLRGVITDGKGIESAAKNARFVCILYGEVVPRLGSLIHVVDCESPGIESLSEKIIRDGHGERICFEFSFRFDDCARER